MINLIKKSSNKVYKKLKDIIFLVFKKSLLIFGLSIELVPYSNWTSSIYLIFKKNLDIKYGIKQNNYFNFNIFSQESDLRAVFNNNWNEASTRIAALASLAKLFDKFDFYDVGANYGTYSLPFTNLDEVSSHVIVEANPILTTCLEQTFLKSKAKIISKAITVPGDAKRMKFNIKPFASGASTLENIKKPTPLSSVQIDVECIDYKNLYETFKHSNNVIIKIDVEGTEIKLLKGNMLKYLDETYQSFIIMIEYIPKIYSVEQNNIYKKKLANYYCVPLTNYNFIRNSNYEHYQKNFFLHDNPIKHFYKTRYGKGIDWFAENEEFSYSDIIIFSSEKLAIQAMKF